MQNYSVKIKNSTISRGTCCHGSLHNAARHGQVHCREPSTKRSHFIQNKANFKKARMNICYYLQKDCENESAFSGQKNKANQSQLDGSATASAFAETSRLKV
jgi:hypothetical protein